MTKTIAILQSNYIPWKGTFDLIRSVDELVILDSVQFTKNDWRNRNRIRTPNGPAWLTIPIQTAGRFSQRIAEAEVADTRWARRHWRTIAQNYSRAPQFRRYAEELEQAYHEAGREPRLSRINRLFLDLICGWLGIGTKITSADCYPDDPDRVERLIGICQAAGAGRYVSGPSARGYLDLRRFEQAGIAVEFLNYDGYPTDPLSVIDTILNAPWQRDHGQASRRVDMRRGAQRRMKNVGTNADVAGLKARSTKAAYQAAPPNPPNPRSKEGAYATGVR
jgi:hypothetical protein